MPSLRFRYRFFQSRLSEPRVNSEPRLKEAVAKRSGQPTRARINDPC